MGNPKQKWTAAEEDALRAGIKKHGTGKWKNIQKDPEFNPLLYSRSNIDLKDKWRNMSVSVSGQGPREKSRTPKTKDSPVNVGQTSGSSSLLVVNSSVASNDVHMEDSSKCFLDGKTASKYNSTLKDPNGSNTSAVGSFIEVQNGYRLQGEVTNGNKGPKMKPKEIRPRSSPINSYLGETLEEAAIGAAYKVAEAENKSFVAAAAVKEAERVSRMAEEAEAFLRLAEEIYDRCNYSQPCFRKVVSK